MVQTMARRSLPTAVAAFFFLSAMAQPMAAAVVEHTFVVSLVKMTHLCKEIMVPVVNQQIPGPTIEVTDGDSVVVHVVNMTPYNITIHWHGVKQKLSCWSDGVPIITQCPIRPEHNFTYRFKVDGQEGTLWWHAHVPWLRVTMHGALIIRPRHGAGSYPFPKPQREIPIIIGDSWDVDLVQMKNILLRGDYGKDDFTPSGATINAKLGDLYNCSGTKEDGYVLEVEPGKTYLLRFISAAIAPEFYIKVAGHKFTVVAADANYVNPYTTDVIAIAPGETVDALLVADALPGMSYYMVAMANDPTIFNPPFPMIVTRGMVQYMSRVDDQGNTTTPTNGGGVIPMAPEMPDARDLETSFHFHGNLTSLRRPGGPSVPLHADEHLFIALTLGTIIRRGKPVLAVSMNNVSFQEPEGATTPLLEAHYYHHNLSWLRTLPDRPPRAFNYTDRALIPFGSISLRLMQTEQATTVRRFRHGTTVEIVFQNTAVAQSDYNVMHLHGHDMFVVAQGHGNYNATKDVARYNLVDPPVRNVVYVPSLGWAAIRFIADNPGMWIFHCHYEVHLSQGMETIFIVEDGPTVDTVLPPPPPNLPKCDHGNSLMEKGNDGQVTIV